MAPAKLTYFDVKGLGESIRLLLAYGGQEFQDVRVRDEDWDELKPNTPYGMLPILEMDGQQFTQSNAIARLLGRKYGLVGKDIYEDFQIDQNIDFLGDLIDRAVAVAYEADEELKKRRHAEYIVKVYPPLLQKLDQLIEKNNGHIALGKVTWGDFVFAGLFDYLKHILQVPGLEEQYPNLRRVQQAVLALPQLKEYLANAPQNEY